jgi:putative Mg2+ transporter-C (MgtC) family protein
MTPVTTIQFLFHLISACALGALVGLEREWHQHMAGARTNALVAAGASAFVMAGSLISGDPAAPGRMASVVVSGIGFLGAGVIFKDGASVHGLNTAATVWCSAAIGVLAGVDSLNLALMLAAMVILANITLRPILDRIRLAVPAGESVDARYEIVIMCRSTEKIHLRALLFATISCTAATLHAIHSAEERETDRARLRTEISTRGRQNELVEKIAARLSIEPSVTSLSWSVTPAAIE